MAGMRSTKPRNFLSSGGVKPAGLKKFANATAKTVQPEKARIYTKQALREDPAAFSDFGFGETGLRSTPSLLGMQKKPQQ